MKTLLDVTNAVLRKLREDQVSGITVSDYAKLTGAFINEVKEEMEDTHTWGALTGDVTVNLVDGQDTYDLRAAADLATGTDTTERSELVYEPKSNLPRVFITQTDQEIRLHEASWAWIDYHNKMTTTQDARPVRFALKQNENGGLSLRVWPTPTSAESGWPVTLTIYTPQEELELDGSDDATTIKVPFIPLRNGVIFYMLNERGEELGEPGNLAERRYYGSLAAAILADAGHEIRNDRFEVVPD